MSLNDSLKAFKSERAEVATRNLPHARPTTTTSSTPARTSTPQPPPKRTHDAAFPTNSSTAGPATTKISEIMRIVIDVVDHLKKQTPASKPLPFVEIIRYLSLPQDLQTPKGLANIKTALKQYHRLTYLSPAQSGNGKESFKYRPLHPVTNGDELRNYLATFDTAQGLPVKDLKDGWPDCNTTLDQLESEGHILVHRKRKDGTALTVYPDNANWHITAPSTSTAPSTAAPKIRPIDDDFVNFWTKIRLPANENDIRTELEKAGLTPTSAVRESGKGPLRKKERKRVDRKNAKKTNVHMAGILKDYSKLRPGGK